MPDPTVRQCPLCKVQAVVDPAVQGRCGQPACPKFEDWPKVEEPKMDRDVPDWYCPMCLGTTWHQFPEDCPKRHVRADTIADVPKDTGGWVIVSGQGWRDHIRKNLHQPADGNPNELLCYLRGWNAAVASIRKDVLDK